MIQLTLTLKMTTAQLVVETSVTVNNNSPIQDYVHPDNQTQPTFELIYYLLYKTPSSKDWQLFPHRTVHFLLGLYKCYSSASFSCRRSEGLDEKTRLMTNIITFGVGNSTILNQDGKMKILSYVACFYPKCLAKFEKWAPCVTVLPDYCLSVCYSTFSLTIWKKKNSGLYEIRTLDLCEQFLLVLSLTLAVADLDLQIKGWGGAVI